MVKRYDRRVTVRFDTSTHSKLDRLLENDSYCLNNGFNRSDLLRKFVDLEIKYKPFSNSLDPTIAIFSFTIIILNY